jgi:hypothetical protein
MSLPPQQAIYDQFIQRCPKLLHQAVTDWLASLGKPLEQMKWWYIGEELAGFDIVVKVAVTFSGDDTRHEHTFTFDWMRCLGAECLR